MTDGEKRDIWYMASCADLYAKANANVGDGNTVADPHDLAKHAWHFGHQMLLQRRAYTAGLMAEPKVGDE